MRRPGRAAVLVAAGLDPSGAAGLLADARAVWERGNEPLGLATALTAQGTGVFRAEPVQAALLKKQVGALVGSRRIGAVKLGVVPTRRHLGALCEGLAGLGVPWVVDPVVRSSRGGRLSSLTARDYRALAAGHVVLTPNLPELAWLLGARKPPRGLDALEAAAGELLAWGFRGVVVKGGHLRGARGPTDLVVERRGCARLSAPWLPRDPVRHRGTGCRFASALACGLAEGKALVPAARAAQRYVRAYLSA